jgi:hypothetical protein
VEFETSAFELGVMAAASPSVSLGLAVSSAKVILGASFGFAGTPDVFGEV